jgi:hypothetical protein
MSQGVKTNEKVFTPYHGFIIAILSLLQFTMILDFMVLSPLGAIERYDFCLNFIKRY